MNPLVERIDARAMLNLQKFQFQEFLLMEDTVPAGGQSTGEVEVSSLGDFVCQYITGTFTTLLLTAGVPPIIDNSVNYLSGQLKDGNGMKNLFNNRIPLNLFCSPGRRRDATSTSIATDFDGNSLFYPMPFEYIFPRSSKIYMDCVNSSDADNYYELVFMGYRVIGDDTIAARDEGLIVV